MLEIKGEKTVLRDIPYWFWSLRKIYIIWKSEEIYNNQKKKMSWQVLKNININLCRPWEITAKLYHIEGWRNMWQSPQNKMLTKESKW